MWRSIILVLVMGLFGVAAACEGPVGPPGIAGSVDGGSSDADVPRGPDDAAPLPPATPGIVGEGLRLDVVTASIGGDRSLTVTFRLTDGAGSPLDREGRRTEGAVTALFVVAWLDADPSGAPRQYSAYTTKDNTSPTTKITANQADADEGGAFAEIDPATGTYTYRFGTILPAGFDATKTHSVGVWAWRDFQKRQYVVNTIFHFVPAGGPVKVTREVVKTQACNGCHNPMSHHEGDVARRDTALCILCHSAPMRDPDSGHSLDFRSMIHKMHRGKRLPSVIAGKSFELFSAEHEADDFSSVVFPQEIQNCPKCHTGAQGDYWKTRPSRLACSSCHDLTSFVAPPPTGMKLHPGGVQADDTKCTQCHEPIGGEAGITAVHRTPTLDPASPVLALKILGVTNTGPGQTPQVRFAVTRNGAALDVLATPLTRLAVTLAGPTTDYAGFAQYVIQGAGATGTLAADIGGVRYTFPAPIPAGATGSYAIGLEGYLQPDALKPEVRFAALNPVEYVAVTDPAPVPRRTVVERTKCNSCHYELAAHGGIRRSPEYCSLCHNPNKVGDERIARFQGSTVTAPSVNLDVMIHKIHMGEKLTQGYTLGGFPAPTPANPGGTPLDFGEVRFPGNQRACWACHAATSYALPVPLTNMATKTSQVLSCTDPAPDPAAYCSTRQVISETFLGPTGAACTACHDTPSTGAHAQIMTTSAGIESCATCHGPGKTWDVQLVHALPP